MRYLSKVFVLTFLICLFISGKSSSNQMYQFSDLQNRFQILEQNEEGLTLQLQIGDIRFAEVSTQQGNFNLIAIEGFARSQNLSEPSLPVLNKMIAVPIDASVHYQILASSFEEIDLESLGIKQMVMPTQVSVSKSDDPFSIPFEMNQVIYEQSAYYALPLVQTNDLGIMRGVRLGMISVSPVEYNPVTNKIRVYNDITVKVMFESGNYSKTYDNYDNHYSPFFEPIYNKLINAESMYGVNKSDLVTYPTKYLIIADRMFESQLQPFIEWKTKKGFTVITAYTDQIGTTTSSIKSYIQSMYNAGTPSDPAPSFVLFVGDAQQIPSWNGSAGSHITDLRYCEFTGDDFPEIYYGRFSAQNIAQLQPQIDKTLEYEQYQMPDPSYLERVTLVSGVDGTYAATHGNGQINYGTDLYFNAAHGIAPNVWLYPASDASGAAADIIESVSDGVGLYNYTAHCSHTGHADPSFTTSDVPGLTNFHQYLLGIGNCCLSNTFGTDYSTPCFGEAFLQLADAGGIGYIGGSNSTYWDEDYWWGVGYGPVVGSGPTYEQTTQGVYDGLFHEHGEPVSEHYITNGSIMFSGNLAVTESGSNLTQYYWEIYHLMGDPSVMTYIGIPSTNTVSHDAVALITTTSFTVNADPGSYVGISFNGALQGAAYVGSSGTVNVPLSGFGTPGVADIVVTAQNKQPYITTIQVITPSGPYVVLDEVVIDDAVGGNGNGLAELGETISLSMTLINVGPDTAYSVNATIASTDFNIALVDDSEPFGQIAPDNGTATVINAFEFDISLDVPDNHSVTFDLTVTGTARDTWEGSFTIPIHAPELAYTSLFVNDAAGNNNGILDPGETANIMLTLTNNGSMITPNVTGTISTTDGNVILDDPYGDFGTIDSSGATAANTIDYFTVTADANCPLGYAVACDLALVSDCGYEITLPFHITVGDRVVFYYDDFSYNQGWTGLGGTAEWEMGATVSSGGDPAQDVTPTSDNAVLGNDLGGQYNSSISTTGWVYSPMIDCAGMTGVELRFYHWLGVESSTYDHAYFEVYNGTDWVTLFENGSTSSQATSWTQDFYDLSAVADGNPNFQIRFGLGSTDGSAVYSGWNIDDIELKGYGYVGTPSMEMSEAEITDSLQPGDSSVKEFVVRNIGDGTLRFWLECDDPWIDFPADMQVIAPGDSSMMDITLNTASLPCGTSSCTIAYSSNDNSAQNGTIPVSLFIYSPDVSVAETSLDETVTSNNSKVYPMTISNNGEGRLFYQVGCQMFLKDSPLASSLKDATAVKSASDTPIGQQPADGDKSSVMESFYAAQDKGYGGPDAFGYQWIDSDEPAGPTYSWIDISAVGTELTLGDDEAQGPFALGFSFPFYDSVYTECFVGSNGILTFDEGSSSRLNAALPTTTVKSMICGWWDDIDMRKGGNVYYYYDAANGRFILSFVNAPLYYSTTGSGSLSFQFVLYPDGKVTLQYGTMDAGSLTLLSGTIGIQNSASDDGLTVVYNADYIHDNMVVEFSTQSWLSANPTGGVIEPYGQAVVDLTFDATDLEDGMYSGMVLVSSNDPDSPAHQVAVTMNVSSWTCLDIDGNTTVDVADLVYLVEYSFSGGPAPAILATADADGDGTINIADIVMMVEFMFASGTQPTCGL